MKRYTTIVLLAALIFGLSLAVRPVWASTPIFDNFDTCTTFACQTIGLHGTLFSFGPSADQWTINVFAAPNECLLVAVTAEFADLEMVVRAPNGQVFRNDDSFLAACTRCPIVKINNTPNNGWYAVSISSFTGAAVEGNFTFRYGRYNLNNPNCAGPTPPFSFDTFETDDDDVKPDLGVEEPPPPGGPGE
jgi:hypothetical protein